MCLAGRAVPAAIPALNRLATRAAGSSVRVDRSYRVFATRRLVRFTEMEYALPRAAAPGAVREIKAIAERFAVGFPLEVRFAAADDVPLSMAYGRETAYVAVHVFRGMPWEPFFRAVEAVAQQAGGRPHWGKRHFRTAATLAGEYPAWDAFAAARARLDPGGVFANAYTDQVLGPPVPAARATG
jgi:L-gulonolactone oxidase